MEMEAIRQSEEREMRLREKQFQAAKVQQEQLLQRLKETGESVPNERSGQQNSPNLRVFEARPISAFSGDSGLPIDATFSTLGSASPSWKRTYIVDNTKQGEKLRNEILTSDEVLEKERFEIDLLKRREVFVEKVETPPEINRLGRRWQAPPEKPYVWPTLRKPVTIQTPSNEPEFTAQTNYHIVDHQEGYEWTPVVRDPGYKKERNNFTPTHSPPEPSRSGYHLFAV
uniref:Uncharacterized protein n=1 Tax=Ditylenchus dipsaci TaxID=166011 RepID=A0A915DV50_9BILA